jgi:hypothetical protein
LAGQGFKLDAVCFKETDNVNCSDVFAVISICEVREEVHNCHRSLCYGEDRGEEMYSVDIVCIGDAGFLFDGYDYDVRFDKLQVIIDIHAKDNCKSMLFLWKRQCGIVSSVASESESSTSSAFAEDVPSAAVVVAAIAAAVIAATVFCCERVGVPDAFRLPGILPDVSVVALVALSGVILVTVVGSNGNAAWGAAALKAASLLLRWLVYAVLTCKRNSASKAAHTGAGIRESILPIDVGERDVILMIGVYWYSRVLLSSSMIL